MCDIAYPEFRLISFNKRESCIPGLNDNKIKSRGDVNYLHNNGFDLSKPVFLMSYFLSSEDGNEEYFLHYGKRVKDCQKQTIAENFKRSLLTEIEQKIQLVEIKKSQ